MKAGESLPLSEPSQAGSNTLSKRPPKGVQTPNDSIYARLRRLEQRIESLEAKASTLRRDVNRIDKQEYREKKRRPSNELPPGNGSGDQLPAGLFGLGG